MKKALEYFRHTPEEPEVDIAEAVSRIFEEAGVEGADDLEKDLEDTVHADADTEPDIEKDPENIEVSTDAQVPEPHEDHDHLASQILEAMKRGACMLSRRRVALQQHIPGGDNQLSLVQLGEDEVTFVKWALRQPGNGQRVHLDRFHRIIYPMPSWCINLLFL